MFRLTKTPQVNRRPKACPVEVAFDVLEQRMNAQGYGPIEIGARLARAGFTALSDTTENAGAAFADLACGLRHRMLFSDRLSYLHTLPQEMRGGLSLPKLKEQCAAQMADEEIALMQSLSSIQPTEIWEHASGVMVLYQGSEPSGRYCDDALYVIVRSEWAEEESLKEAEALLDREALRAPAWFSGKIGSNGSHNVSRYRRNFRDVFAVSSRLSFGGRGHSQIRYDGAMFPSDYRASKAKWANDPNVPFVFARVRHDAVSV
jgi:hypothetical protein